MSRSGRQLRLVLIGMMLVVSLPAVINYTVDPYQLFRKSKTRLSVLHSNNRVQAAGLINSYLADDTAGFDTVTIGTSMGQNFVPSMVQAYLKTGKVLKLNAPGAEGTVQLFLANRALQEPTLTTVLWEICPVFYSEAHPKRLDEIPTFPRFLYGSSFADKFKMLFNGDMLEDSMDVLTKSSSPVDYDDWNIWFHEKSWEQDRQRELEPAIAKLEIEQSTGNPIEQLTIEDLLGALADLNYPLIDNVVDAVRSRPDVHFEFFFPPRSALDYISRDTLPRLFFVQYEATRKLAPLPNARVHGFDDLAEIVLNFDNYKDPSHYAPHVNERILEAISTGSQQVHQDNIEGYLARRLRVLNELVQMASTGHIMR